MKEKYHFNLEAARKLLALGLSTAMLGSLALPVGAMPDNTPAEATNTYYFLAPDNYFITEKGAVNEQVGAYWWQPSEPDEWPGVEMEPAPEIGTNVFKIENVSPETGTIIFNNYVSSGNDPSEAYQTVNINAKGYGEEECPYDETLTTNSFDGWIYVLNLDTQSRSDAYSPFIAEGAWFTLDDYQNYDDYYGSYDKDPIDYPVGTYYFLAPDNFFIPAKGAENENVGVYWWDNNESSMVQWPGETMTPAPEVGENVYMAQVSDQYENIIFNDYVMYDGSNSAAQTVELKTTGYAEGECPYNKDLITNSFNGWIFVLDLDSEYKEEYSPTKFGGAWFTLDDYMNHDDYYGKYLLDDKKETYDTPSVQTADEPTPDEPYNPYYSDDYYTGGRGKLRFQADGDVFGYDDTILFYVWNESWGEYATQYGWTWNNTWGSENELAGTNLGNGLFESYEFSLPEDNCAIFVIAHDLTTGEQTCDVMITSNAFNDTLSITGKLYEHTLESGFYTYEAVFSSTASGGPAIRITKECTLVGTIRDPRTNYAWQLAYNIYNDLYDTNGIYFTRANVANVMSALDLDPDDVWNEYRNYAGFSKDAYEIIYNEDFDAQKYFAQFEGLDLSVTVTHYEEPAYQAPQNPNETSDYAMIEVTDNYEMALTVYAEDGAPLYTAEFMCGEPYTYYKSRIFETTANNTAEVSSIDYYTEGFGVSVKLFYNPVTGSTWMNRTGIYPTESYIPALYAEYYDYSIDQDVKIALGTMTLDPESEDGHPVYRSGELLFDDNYTDYNVRVNTPYGWDQWCGFWVGEFPEVYTFSYDVENNSLECEFVRTEYGEQYFSLHPVAYLSYPGEDIYDEDGNWITPVITETFDMALTEGDDGRPQYTLDRELPVNSYYMDSYVKCGGQTLYAAPPSTGDYTSVVRLIYDPISNNAWWWEISCSYDEKYYNMQPQLRYFGDDGIMKTVTMERDNEYEDPVYAAYITLDKANTKYTFILEISKTESWTYIINTAELGKRIKVTYWPASRSWDIYCVDEFDVVTPEPGEQIAGDADGDGCITSLDALTALRASVFVDELTEEQLLALDVDGDGMVTSIDAVSILRYSIGKSYIGTIGSVI